MNQETVHEAPSAAKQAEDKALGHVAALHELSREFPSEKRTPEDEAVLRELASEGHELRRAANEAQPVVSVPVDQEGVVLTPKEQGADEEAHVGGRVG